MDYQYRYMSYNKVGVRTTTAQQRGRGFRLNHRRFSVYRLRTKFLYFIRVLSRWSWKSSFGSLKKGINGGSASGSCKRSDSRKGLARDATGVPQDCKLRSYGRSNSFYSEAIADCLEFIKRSSVSEDDENSVVQRG